LPVRNTPVLLIKSLKTNEITARLHNQLYVNRCRRTIGAVSEYVPDTQRHRRRHGALF
jgi:hypothetical protein